MDEDKSPQTPYVYIYNTGHVYDDSPLRVVSTCKLGIYSFPFDIQNCSLTFGSYIHFGKQLHRKMQVSPPLPWDSFETNAPSKVSHDSEIIFGVVVTGKWSLLQIKYVNMKPDQASLFVLATDIQVFPSTTAAEILEESINVAQTKGEWELINIEIIPATLEIADGKYSQLKYYVCC